jgi:hypothetical protein
VKVLKGNYMTDTADNVEKRDLVITRLFDAPIEMISSQRFLPGVNVAQF